MDDLNAQLLNAHARGDGSALVALYQGAARETDDDAARGFFLTHAYVYALERGHRDAPDLHAALKSMGREE